MKAYVLISGIIFGLITMAHIARAALEGPHIATDPFFLVVSLAAIALCVWSISLLRRWPRT